MRFESEMSWPLRTGVLRRVRWKVWSCSHCFSCSGQIFRSNLDLAFVSGSFPRLHRFQAFALCCSAQWIVIFSDLNLCQCFFFVAGAVFGALLLWRGYETVPGTVFCEVGQFHRYCSRPVSCTYLAASVPLRFAFYSPSSYHRCSTLGVFSVSLSFEKEKLTLCCRDSLEFNAAVFCVLQE